MILTAVRYLGQLRCQAVHGPSGSTLTTDAPVDNQGRGESFSPTDLLATALATCMMTIMGIVAERRGLDLGGSEATVEKHMTATPPRRIQRLVVTFRLPHHLPAEERERLEAAAYTCPVALSLHPDVAVACTFTYPA